MLNISVQQHVFWEGKEEFLLTSDIDSYWIMYIIEQGACEYKIGSSEGVAESGDILLCPPYINFERKVLEVLNFHFFRFGFYNELINTELFGLYSLQQKERIEYNCNLLKKIQYDDSLKIRCFRDHLLSDIVFMYFYENNLIIQSQKNTTKDELINEALVLLADLTPEAMPIAEIAETLNVNPCHFSRKFKNVMGGITPIEYRTKVRIEEAQKKLIETNDSIVQIAELCGFKNGFYFSRIFTKIMGEAPSIYRNKHKI